MASYLGTSSEPRAAKSLIFPDELQAHDDDNLELRIAENYFFEDPEKTIDLVVLDGITDFKNLAVSFKCLFRLLLPMLHVKSGMEDDWYALRWACFHGCIPTLEAALRSGADVDHKFAMQADYTDWLSYRRVNRNALGRPQALRRRTFKAGTPLLAALYGEVLIPKNNEIVNLLLSRKVNVNLEDYNWIAPLHVVSRHGVHRRSTVELLLKYGADVTTQGPRGWTSLHMTCWRPKQTFAVVDFRVFVCRTLPSYDDKAMRLVARMLIEAGADLKAQTSSPGSCGSAEPTRSGLTSLQLALHCQNDTMAGLLREQEHKSLNASNRLME